MPDGQVRLRVTYAKQGSLRFTGHLDLQRVWERTLRRSTLPVAYSQGFHPQARIQMACSLPLGITSCCEIVDFWLENPIPLLDVTKALNRGVHPGMEILQVKEVDLKEPPLQTRDSSAEYRAIIDPSYTPDEVFHRVQTILASVTLIRTRREKTYDLRPLIEELAIENPEETPIRLCMRLSARESATGRPEEVLAALGIKFEDTLVQRTAIFFRD